MRTIRLKEYQSTIIPRNDLSEAEAEELYRLYGRWVEIDFPSPATRWDWRLNSSGWVGTIPLSSGLRLILEPRTPVTNIFRMLEWAYDLESFHILKGVTEVASLEDVYRRLAVILAKRVLERGRKGLYRAYVPEEERSSYVRGSIDLSRSLREPWRADLHCRYQEHTSDVIENQILASTLHAVARRGICCPDSLGSVRAAYRSLHGLAGVRRMSPSDCIGLLYNRLNEDYRPLHALCRFFLEHAGPSHESGDRTMLPFLVNMARLYELFVAKWTAAHLPQEYRVTAQESVLVDPEGTLRINIDLVLTHGEERTPTAVLDTKYKVGGARAADLSQVVSYAVAKNCRRAILIYPVMPDIPVSTRYGAGDVHVQTLAFGIEGDLDAAGRRFLASLLDNDPGRVGASGEATISSGSQ